MARIAVANRVAATRTNNILYNGDFEIKPATITAATRDIETRWVDGTVSGSSARSSYYGWGAVQAGLATSAEIGFDTTVFRSGTTSMRVSTLNATGAFTAGTPKNSISITVTYQGFPILPNTSYTISGYIKTNNVKTNGSFLDFRQYSSTPTLLVTTSTNKLSGTNDWTLVTATVTTNASASLATVLLRNSVAGNISDAWFDDLTLIPAATTPSLRVAAANRVTP